MPSALAVLRLTTHSHFVGSSAGKSRGLASFRILSPQIARRRKFSRRSIPYHKTTVLNMLAEAVHDWQPRRGIGYCESTTKSVSSFTECN
jgi:hypothetical protein